ncbi:MAG: methyltransferase, partial [Candidatus Aminicenantes bacterium]|nr:methyltransferase [Candidatus Aminicenantes bacterium]
MKHHRLTPILAGLVLFISAGTAGPDSGAQVAPGRDASLDAKVRAFLEKSRYSWRDMNVPESDGKILFDLIVDNNYTRALEIGTSTGHSAVWMAWALSRTGGKLITVEIDAGRHREAVANFREAGLAAFVDARLADAHELVPALPGPFDFVFIDADKDWYTNYARAVIPKLAPGGCIAAHNVYAPRPGARGRWRGGTGDYYEFMSSQPGFETSIHPGSRSGL